MQRFRVTYDNGFVTIEAKDLWTAVEMVRREVRRTFRNVRGIERLPD